MEIAKTTRTQKKLHRLYNELFWLRRRYALMGDDDGIKKIDDVRQMIVRHLENNYYGKEM